MSEEIEEYSEEYMDLTCDNCDNHIDDCECGHSGYCNQCDYPISECECDYCDNCDNRIDDCECESDEPDESTIEESEQE